MLDIDSFTIVVLNGKVNLSRKIIDNPKIRDLSFQSEYYLSISSTKYQASPQE